MTTVDFITQLFCRVDDKLTQQNKNQKHSQANLYPSEGVTIALLFALKGVKTIINPCSPIYPSEAACFDCSTIINI